MPTATLTNAGSRLVKEGQLREVRAKITLELDRRPLSDLTPYGQYTTLVQLERQLMDELDLRNGSPWA